MLTIPVHKGKYGLTKVAVYFGCLYFCVYYLHELFAKRYLTYFETTNSSPTNSSPTYPFLSICVSLSLDSKRIAELKRLTSGEPDKLNNAAAKTLRGRQNYIELVEYYSNRSLTKTPKQILEKATGLRIHDGFSLDPPAEDKPRLDHLTAKSSDFSTFQNRSKEKL